MTGTSGDDPTTSPYARALSLSRDAHARRQHEVAYHALAAAMHAAVDARDARALAEAGREATAQIAWIDRHAPAHRLATASARQHGHPGVYAMLVRQVAAHEQILDKPQAPSAGAPSAGARPGGPADR